MEVFNSHEYLSLKKVFEESSTPSPGANKSNTRLERRRKARGVVTLFAKAATELTPEAVEKIVARDQKIPGIRKDHLFMVFNKMVNPQLEEKVTTSSFWKYLFQGSRSTGLTIEPLYGDTHLHKTTRKGGGTKRLTGVTWRGTDPQSLNEMREAVAELKNFGVEITEQELLANMEREDNVMDHIRASPITLQESHMHHSMHGMDPSMQQAHLQQLQSQGLHQELPQQLQLQVNPQQQLQKLMQLLSQDGTVDKLAKLLHHDQQPKPTLMHPPPQQNQ